MSPHLYHIPATLCLNFHALLLMVSKLIFPCPDCDFKTILTSLLNHFFISTYYCTKIINLSLSTGVLPEKFKKYLVLPNHIKFKLDKEYFTNFVLYILSNS